MLFKLFVKLSPILIVGIYILGSLCMYLGVLCYSAPKNSLSIDFALVYFW